jgi:Fe-Mn family superoxide dismutase
MTRNRPGRNESINRFRDDNMEFRLDPLPYEPHALEPHISGQTVDVHYHKHHYGYLRKLESEISGTLAGDLPLNEIVTTAPAGGSVFRNAAQVWNHTFYWNSLAPDGGGRPGGALGDSLKRDFGGIDDFKHRLAEVAMGEFGSGWAWLVADRSGRLSVLSTSDADNPMRSGRRHRPILGLDVWEHAYYLDYRNERDQYVEACLDNLLNWRFAASNFAAANNETAPANDQSAVHRQAV